MRTQKPRTIAALLAAAALVVAACGTTESDPEPGLDTTSPPTTVEQTPDPTLTPVHPVPQDYAEVESEFSAGVEHVSAIGRRVAANFVTGSVDAVYSELSTGFAQEISLEELQAAHADVISQTPIGNLESERVHILGPDAKIYEAAYTWGDQSLTLSMMLDAADQVGGLSMAPRHALPADPSADYRSDVDYRLPFDGLWLIAWGGDTASENYHVIDRAQRHALDILVWKDGATHTGSGTSNEDYWAYGQPVLSPATGEVVTVIDGLPDQAPRVETDAFNPAGNYVVIETAPGEYVLIAHLKPGSITVSEGDLVDVGEQIAQVGNSGNTSEPHIHIHAQDAPTFDPNATGLPLRFGDYLANGAPVDLGEPTGGQFVAKRWD
jgi:murein DD-endopeptidase MepM/ murein hydrolase activator NlpD